MDLFQAILLGIVQGATEFIPISSSAHLIIVPWLLRWDDPGLAFDVALHLGTLSALLIFFARDWIRLFRAGIASVLSLRAGFTKLPVERPHREGEIASPQRSTPLRSADAAPAQKLGTWGAGELPAQHPLRAFLSSCMPARAWNPRNDNAPSDDVDRRLAWWLVIGSIPGALVGALFESKIEELFHTPNAQHNATAMIAMGVIIALLGAALFAAERSAQHTRALEHLALHDAILIGCAQALALFPGVSRSGATITAGLALGLEREAAARFSFLLSAPIIAGAGAKSAFNLARAGIAPAELTFFAVGFLAAAISGYLCIKILLRFLRRNSTDVFVYYRWLLAVLVIVVAVMR